MHEANVRVEETLTNVSSKGILLHEKAQEMPHLPVARFTRRPGDRRIYGFADRVYVSSDGGGQWQAAGDIAPESGAKPCVTGAFMGTKNGTLIAAFANDAERANWDWDPQLKDSPGARLPTYVVRSTDGGQTWGALRKLHDEWTGANQCMIQTRSGRVVFSSMKMRHNPGRHTVLTYGSDDDGITWEPSNVIDLGGNGHHGGVSEGTLVELRDGRLLQYVRTNWGRFWTALSSDEGRHWHPYGPSDIEASSAPGDLKRLASGRIVLAWNRFYPHGTREVALQGGDGQWSATPVSNFRAELSLSFSDDECRSWSPPVVVACNKGNEVSYPCVFEPEPGVLWITAHRFGLAMMVREEDMLRPCAS